MITLEEAARQNSLMQDQGRRLLAAAGIEELFARYGRYVIRGSFVHGLMVPKKPDIDGSLFMEEPSLPRVMELVQELLKRDEVQRVALEKGAMVEPERGLRDWYVLQVKMPFEGVLWNLDLHCVAKDDGKELDYLSRTGLTEEQREAALWLKARLVEERLYPASSKLPGSFASVDVYRAVIEDGVRTVEEMKQWAQGQETAAQKWRKKH